MAYEVDLGSGGERECVCVRERESEREMAEEAAVEMASLAHKVYLWKVRWDSGLTERVRE